MEVHHPGPVPRYCMRESYSSKLPAWLRQRQTESQKQIPFERSLIIQKKDAVLKENDRRFSIADLG
jgi:hypothetical protein